MKKLSPQDVDHLARLASLNLTPAEKQKFSTQITSILEHVNQIQRLPLDGVPTTNQVTHKTNEFRADTVKPSFTQEKALANAPKTYQGYFVVPRLIHHDSTE